VLIYFIGFLAGNLAGSVIRYTQKGCTSVFVIGIIQLLSLIKVGGVFILQVINRQGESVLVVIRIRIDMFIYKLVILIVLDMFFYKVSAAVIRIARFDSVLVGYEVLFGAAASACVAYLVMSAVFVNNRGRQPLFVVGRYNVCVNVSI